MNKLHLEFFFFWKSRVRGQKVAYSSAYHQSKHKFQKTIASDHALQIGEKSNHYSQEYCWLQYPTDLVEYTEVEHSCLDLSYSLKDNQKIVSNTNTE